MTKTFDLANINLPAAEKEWLKRFLEEITRIGGDDLRSIALYGSVARGDYAAGRSDINVMVITETINVPMLKNALDEVTLAQRHAIRTVFITPEELKVNASLFPSKYLSIKENHITIHGSDMFAGLVIDPETLLFRLRQEVNSILFKLRYHYAHSGGQDLTNMMNRNARGIFRIARMALSLTSQKLENWDAVANIASARFELDTETFRRIGALRKRDIALPRADAEKLYDDCLTLLRDMAKALEKMSREKIR